jgi:hypothetical protein
MRGMFFMGGTSEMAIAVDLETEKLGHRDV